MDVSLDIKRMKILFEKHDSFHKTRNGNPLTDDELYELIQYTQFGVEFLEARRCTYTVTGAVCELNSLLYMARARGMKV